MAAFRRNTKTMATAQALALGTLLKRLRRAAGLTQVQLADRAGYSAVYIGMIERGERLPQDSVLDALAAALELAPGQHTALLASAHAAERSGDVSPTASALPLVGREREVAALERHLMGKSPPLLLVAGEPGIGKSRLLAEAAGRAATHGLTVLAGGCRRRSAQEPFAPILDAMEHAIAQLAPDSLSRSLQGCDWLARLLPELGESGALHVPASVLPPAQERRMIFRAVRRLLANLAGLDGTLLLLDDVQWMSSDAGDLLAMLARAGDGPPIRIVAAYRDAEVPATGWFAALIADLARENLAHPLHLGPLADNAAHDLFQSLVDGHAATDEALNARVVRRAGGVPLFLVSCAQAVRSGELAPGDEHMVPEDVAALVRQRVAQLPAAGPQLLQVAALVGRPIPRAVLLDAPGEVAPERADILAALDAATQAGLLVEQDGDAYRFTHDLIHEAIIADLSAARRAELHRQVAHALEAAPGEPQVERLAHHFARGGEPARAVTYLERAAERAQARQAYSEAADLQADLANTLDALGEPARAAAMREELGQILKLAARYDAALAAYDRAARSYRALGDHEGYARATAQYARMHINRGTPEAGLARLLALVDPLGAHLSAGARANVLMQLGMIHDACGRYNEALAAAERAIPLADEAHDRRLRGQARRLRAFMLNMLGRTAEGTPALIEALPLLDEAGDQRDLCFALNHLAWLDDIHGEFAGAARYFDQAVSAAEQLGDPAVLASMLCNRADIAFSQGEWERTRAGLVAARTLADDVEESWITAFPRVQMGLLELAQQQLDAVPETLEAAALLARRTNNVEPLRWAECGLAERDLLLEQPARARARLAPLLDRHGQQELDGIRPLALLAWARAEDGAEAGALITEAIQRAREQAMRPVLAHALWVRALLDLRANQLDEATSALAESLALAHAMPLPYAEGKALYLDGLLNRQRGDRAGAAAQLDAARAVFSRLGERMYAGMVEAMRAAL
jgi:transcriptional regulator with XRE-family HTH domain/tetratricopeptide (TPR) repeat protein